MSAAICGTFPGIAEFIIGPRFARPRWLTRATKLGRGERSPRKNRGLSLALGRRDGETVELVGHLDLARQARIRPHVEAEIQHVLFHRRGRTDLLLPGFV